MNLVPATKNYSLLIVLFFVKCQLQESFLFTFSQVLMNCAQSTLVEGATTLRTILVTCLVGKVTS